MITDSKTVINEMKGEIDRVLLRYRVPMDDRTFVLEKVDALRSLMDSERAEFQEGIGAVRTEINRERDTVRREVAGIRDTAVQHVGTFEAKVEEAYQDGLAQGAADHPPRPGLFQILIGVSLTALAAFIVLREIFPKKS